MAARTLQVFNLEFPSYRDEMEVCGYRFVRVPEYRERTQQLAETVAGFREFARQATTGSHAITATVATPESELPGVLAWGDPGMTALDDILLLLSLFTSRHCFAVDRLDAGDVVVADPRQYVHGRSLKLSLPQEFVVVDDPIRANIGFEKGVASVCGVIRTQEWRDKYRRGSFLLLFREACKRQALEASFVLCWAVLEHLFRLLNPSIPERAVWNTSGARKVAVVFREYGLDVRIREQLESGLRRFVRIRNSLIHEGVFPDDKATAHALTFVRVVEQVIARVLSLPPADIAGATDDFHATIISEAEGERGP